MIAIGSVITGIGSYVPETKLTNEMLEGMVDTNDEWIVKRTGIKERRIAQGKATWEIALEAADKALSDANKKPEEIDLIIAATVTPDSYTPSLACMIQGKLDAMNAAAFDISAACSGFAYAVDIADSYIKVGKAKTILVVCAEILSRIVDYKDRSTCVLFGDGAGAAIIEKSDTEEGIISTYIAANGKLGEALVAKALPVEENPLTGNREFSSSDRFIHMGGNDVFRFTAMAVPKAIDEVLSRSGRDIKDVDWIVPHQANDRIIQMVISRYGLDKDKVYVNIDRFGNTSSASIPLCLDEMKQNGLLKKGQLVVFVGFGGGLTYGSILIRI